MLFRSYKSSVPLSDFIETWIYSGFDSPVLKERIFPSGTFELVFNLRDDEIQIYKRRPLLQASSPLKTNDRS